MMSPQVLRFSPPTSPPLLSPGATSPARVDARPCGARCAQNLRRGRPLLHPYQPLLRKQPLAVVARVVQARPCSNLMPRTRSEPSLFFRSFVEQHTARSSSCLSLPFLFPCCAVHRLPCLAASGGQPQNTACLSWCLLLCTVRLPAAND
ncbi:unnamed protein product, partial [Ectocarpus sp. 8 AP-2014]